MDTTGNIYVTDMNNKRVLKLPAGSNTQVELPPLTGLIYPGGVAVDTAGNIYAPDLTNNRVFKLPAGSNTPVELPFTGLNFPQGAAVDISGNVYVADAGNNRVLKLRAGSKRPPVELPYTDLNHPQLSAAGHRRQRLRHRHRKQPGAEIGGGIAPAARTAYRLKPEQQGGYGVTRMPAADVAWRNSGIVRSPYPVWIGPPSTSSHGTTPGSGLTPRLWACTPGR